MLKRHRNSSKAEPSTTGEKCSFCGADAVNMVEGDFPKAFCLLHYYTTRACRKKNVRLLGSTIRNVEEEHCEVQELFAEAFLSLQREIKEAAASYDPKDPLSLLDNSNKISVKQRSNETKVSHQKVKFDGGFMPDITDIEKKLMEQHMKSSVITEAQPNPYKRKKFPSSTIWHQAMNSTLSDTNRTEPSQYLEKCSCGSDKIVRNGYQKSEEGAKAEIWGSKQDKDLVDQYRCLTCGSTWN